MIVRSSYAIAIGLIVWFGVLAVYGIAIEAAIDADLVTSDLLEYDRIASTIVATVAALKVWWR